MQQQLFDLIENTNRSIFLTGRAGTGKTTFLQNFVQTTSKKHAIVAPTGIAAINAGGITIHSMFGLPLSTFVPTIEYIDRNTAINIPNLIPHFKYRRDKLKLLRTLEILIIDEVSMLRCDVLDMIDFALRNARKSQLRFGGVQILFIGDLYQLPPVVKAESEKILYNYYNSPFFFDAKALENLNLITVALTKVYRQTDKIFLQLLNSIRDNDIDYVDFDLLHSRYQPAFEPEEFYVHLVSHNYMADAINNQHLKSLPSKSKIYKAKIWGDFKPHLFPNEEELQLKEGAQIMFIRNDSSESKRFFNGKLATINTLKDDEIEVLPQNETSTLTINRETWENKKYYVDDNNKIAEDVVGSYEQFPFKLAWAVTIHKSQGLTFDKIIIDAGKSFTSGQVYVALSRCRTLEGIVLKSKIPAHAIINDKRINVFEKQTEAGETIVTILETEKFEYAINKIINKINIVSLIDAAEDWEKAATSATHLDNIETLNNAKEILLELNKLKTVFDKFSIVVINKVKQFTQTQKDWPAIEEKCSGAVNFYFKNINTKVLTALKDCYAETKASKGLKGYNDILKHFMESTASYLKELKEVKLLDALLYKKEMPDEITIDVAKKPSHIITFQLFEEEKTVKEIAELRNISEGTVLGHLAKMASAGVVDIKRLFPLENIKLFEDRFRKHNFESVSEWKNLLPEHFDYNEIRVLLNHFRYFGEKVN